MPRFSTVDDYIAGHPEWRDELLRLRDILQRTALEETVKWGAPCYVYRGKNVIGVGAFKGWVALWFHQGALLSDPNQVLINAQEGKTRGLRQWRFTAAKEIRSRWLQAYVKEAIGLVEAGKEVGVQRTESVELPAPLVRVLDEQPPVREAFESLTPGRQREYARFIAEPKREATREQRLAKVLPMIQAGHGLNDRYRK